MARIYDVLSRFILFEDALQEPLAQAGGMLKVGIYEIDLDVKDIASRAKLALETLRESPFLKDVVQFDASVPDLDSRIDEVLADFEWQQLVAPGEFEKPKLHLKVSFFATAEAWGVLSHAELADFLIGYVDEWAQQVANPFVYTDIDALPQNLGDRVNQLVQTHRESFSAEERERFAAYLMVGSHNQDERAFFLDGDVAFVVSGRGAGHALADILILMGNSHWVSSLEELHEFIPEPGNVSRFLGHFGRDVI